MSDEPENIVLIYLRRLDAKTDRVLEELTDVKHRVTALELQIGQYAATEQSHYAASMSRFDRIETRLDRLERRGDILPA